MGPFGLGPTSLAALGLQTHVAHEPLNPASRMAAPFSAQFSVDAGCAIDPPLGCEDATDVAAQLGFRLRARFCAIPSSWGAQVPYRTLHSTGEAPFSDLPSGAAFWYENSNGLAEIAVNQGRADHELGVSIDMPIEIVS